MISGEHHCHLHAITAISDTRFDIHLLLLQEHRCLCPEACSAYFPTLIRHFLLNPKEHREAHSPAISRRIIQSSSLALQVIDFMKKLIKSFPKSRPKEGDWFSASPQLASKADTVQRDFVESVDML